MIAERKRQVRQIAFGFKSRVEILLITVRHRPDRFVVLAIKFNLPWRLIEISIGNAGVVLHHDIRRLQQQRARLGELIVV